MAALDTATGPRSIEISVYAVRLRRSFDAERFQKGMGKSNRLEPKIKTLS